MVDPVLSLVVTLFQDLQVSSCVGSGRGLEELPLGSGYEVYIISERSLATVLYAIGDKLLMYSALTTVLTHYVIVLVIMEYEIRPAGN